MSTLSPTSEISQSQSSPPDFSHFTDLADTLQQAAQSLLAFMAKEQPPEPFEEDSDEPEDSEPVRALPRELRCYSVPPFILEYEKNLLSAHKADDLSHLLDKVYDDLHVMAYLMKHFDESAKVDGFMLQLLGGNLQSTLDLLSSIASVFADFELIDQPETA